MAGFEDYAADTREIELEIERKGIVLGIDWADELQVRELAREALDHSVAEVRLKASESPAPTFMAKLDLFGLAAIMLKTMQESADLGIESHGGPAWKSFAKALWAEAERRKAGG